MTELIATMIVFLLAALAMSVGLLVGDRRLKGSCGGMNNLKKLMGFNPCEGCKKASPDCPLRTRIEDGE